MAVLAGVVGVAAAAAAGAAAAAAGTAAAAAPPPFSAPANASLGAFHLLAGLRCDTAAPGAVDGGRRGYTTVDAAGDAATFAIDPAACWSPVTDPRARSSWRRVRGGGGAAGGAPPSLSGGEPLSVARGDWLHWGEHLARLRNLDPTGRTTHSVTYKPLHGGGGGGTDGDGDGGGQQQQQLLQEAAVLRSLTLQRNSVAGSVHRRVGVYDVLALSRVAVGLCQTADCGDLSALNVLGSRAGDYYNTTHLPLLTHTDAASGGRRPVAMADEDLLALGRAVVANPAWLGGAPESWAIRAGFSLHAYSRVGLAGSPPVRADPLGAPWRRHTVWNPADGRPAAVAARAKWLQAVAWVWCRPPADSFVVKDLGRLCGGGAGGEGAGAGAGGRGGVKAGTATSMVDYTTEWTFDPNHHEAGGRAPALQQPPATRLPPCNFTAKPWHVSDPVTRLGWLLGRSSREVSPASAAEVALARSIAACAHPLRPAPRAAPAEVLPRIKWLSISRLAASREEVQTLSQRYDRSVWGSEPPAEPASNSAVILAFVVVVPEGVALASLLLRARAWGRADRAAVVLTFLAGLVSTAGLVALTVEEAAGRAWRGASLRDELAATFPAGAPLAAMTQPLTGVPLYRVETLYLAARLGYRVRLLTALTAAVAAVYAAIFVAMAVVAVRRRWGLCGGKPRGGGGCPHSCWKRVGRSSGRPARRPGRQA